MFVNTVTGFIDAAGSFSHAANRTATPLSSTAILASLFWSIVRITVLRLEEQPAKANATMHKFAAIEWPHVRCFFLLGSELCDLIQIPRSLTSTRCDIQNWQIQGHP